VDRRSGAAECGAIAAVVNAMKAHKEIPAAQEIGIATLRLIVYKAPALQAQAMNEGASADWVKPERGGILSFRFKGFGTQRRQKARAAGASS